MSYLTDGHLQKIISPNEAKAVLESPMQFFVYAVECNYNIRFVWICMFKHQTIPNIGDNC